MRNPRLRTEEDRERRYAALRRIRDEYGVPVALLADAMLLHPTYLKHLCQQAGCMSRERSEWKPTTLQLQVKAMRERQPPLTFGQIGARLGMDASNAYQCVKVLRENGIAVP